MRIIVAEVIFDRHQHESLEGVFWIPPVVEFFRRLEILASLSTASSEEALTLAEEATLYIRENRIKGIIAGDHARTLAILLDKRDSTEAKL